MRDLGADEIIDYETMRFDEIAGAVDVVLDTMGGETQERSWKVLKRGGILVSTVSPPSSATAAAHGVRSAFVFIQPNAAQLAGLDTLFDEFKLKVHVATVLPLAEKRGAPTS